MKIQQSVAFSELYYKKVIICNGYKDC